MQEFVRVASTRDLSPGEMRQVWLEGRQIGLANINGIYRAFGVRCPHAGARLLEGSLRGGVLTCPLHHWSFDLASGRPLLPPGADLWLATFEVRLDGEDVLVSRFPRYGPRHA